ncbi:hypothetical protein J7T55_013857 [Diaporthe amygdali]|uniref:uncharacterized protein n=1 Tax=Phomopsis amygdali TaxID=1214568 RepID=UPI0022FF4554|nr:uncharacterized protein J7T55_013857 [Diaporthe amygdali]KAJ0119654.1 hypothetical protein J7T55_013857 [Diaporthe amygdali]
MHSHPIGHISIGVRNYEAAKRFYGATLPLIGLHLVYDSTTTTPSPSSEDDGPRTLGYGPDADNELLNVFEYGPHASAPGPGSHIAFNTDSRDVVDQFYEAAIRNGGKSNGGPGVRPHYGRNYYAAFVIDPDGWRLEVVCKEEVGGEATQTELGKSAGIL